MLKISDFEVLGWEHAIRGMRNPMNSWAKSDSEVSICECEHWPHDVKKSFARLGSNDLDLMKRLRNAGTDHRKFMRMITVYVDLTGPLYWWKEFDTYKVGTVANSCSTMHKIAEKEFTLEDFSCEHLQQMKMAKMFQLFKTCGKKVSNAQLTILILLGIFIFPLMSLVLKSNTGGR